MRNVSTWDPFRDLMNIQERINRVFNESTRDVSTGNDENLGSGTWTPVVDIEEREDAFLIRADLPGVRKEDITIDINNNTLTLKGERKFEGEITKGNYIRVERSYGSFSRSFSLPNNVDAKNIKAKFRDGILELTLPKKEEAKPKKIEIDVS